MNGRDDRGYLVGRDGVVAQVGGDDGCGVLDHLARFPLPSVVEVSSGSARMRLLASEAVFAPRHAPRQRLRSSARMETANSRMTAKRFCSGMQTQGSRGWSRRKPFAPFSMSRSFSSESVVSILTV